MSNIPQLLVHHPDDNVGVVVVEDLKACLLYTSDAADE